jgi:hypothetical protein
VVVISDRSKASSGCRPVPVFSKRPSEVGSTTSRSTRYQCREGAQAVRPGSIEDPYSRLWRRQRLFTQRLRTASFAHVTTYDPSAPKFCARPEMQFDLITSFETFEHLLDPLSPNGVVPFSTLVQPPALKAAA